MSEFLSEDSTPIGRARLQAAFALFESARALIDLDTSQDPYHRIFRSFIAETDRRPAGRILEIGSRARSGNVYKGLFRNYSRYVGLDIIEGENVDVVGDIHRLSRYFEEVSFDFVYSISTFEHLAMPWKAVLEINKVMSTGGWLYIATHPCWPPHERPWDFWRFSEEGFQVLLNRMTGFEILECSAGLPCSIVPFGHEESMKGLCEQRANLGISVIARKIGPSDGRLAWDVDVSEILDTDYPSSPPRVA
jgi:SAM-dependent methyltransferase